MDFPEAANKGRCITTRGQGEHLGEDRESALPPVPLSQLSPLPAGAPSAPQGWDRQGAGLEGAVRDSVRRSVQSLQQLMCENGGQPRKEGKVGTGNTIAQLSYTHARGRLTLRVTCARAAPWGSSASRLRPEPPPQSPPTICQGQKAFSELASRGCCSSAPHTGICRTVGKTEPGDVGDTFTFRHTRITFFPPGAGGSFCGDEGEAGPISL